jgi:hypothetical protein
MFGVVLLPVMALGACGPIQFVSQVTIRAEKSVADAKLQQADKYAPYEYYGAEAYLEQAKHRAGFGDFQTCYRYGKKAEKMAKEAVRLTKIRREEEEDVTKPSGADAPPARERDAPRARGEEAP